VNPTRRRHPRRWAPFALAAVPAVALAWSGLGTHAQAAAAPGPVLIHDVRAGVTTTPLGKVKYPVDETVPQPDTQIEPSIAVNPADPDNAVTVFQEDRVAGGGDADNAYATTFDGGRTWIAGHFPKLTRLVGGPFDRASDAVVTFGADPANPGKYLVYANHLVFDDGTSPSGDTKQSGMAVNVSRDGGRTWSDPVFLEQDGIAGLNDKNWIVVDNGTGSGHHTGRVYVVWDRVAPMVYTYCDSGCDQLANWSNAPENNGAFYVFNPGPGIGSIPLVLGDGSLGILFEGDFGGTPAVEDPPTDQPDVRPPNTQLMYAVAEAAGSVPFPLPLTFTQAAVGVASDQTTCCAEQRAGTLPAAAIDPKSGRIYAVWEDSRFRTDQLNDVVVTSSADGITWTPAARVNPGPTGDHVDRFDPSVDVGADGIVRVAYRQRDEHHGPATGRSDSGMSPRIDTYYQQSADGGSTWTAPLKVNTVETDVGYAAFSRSGAFQGDYDQLAVASDGRSYIARDESYAMYPGEPCNCSFLKGNGHQHQHTWVAVVGSGGPSSGVQAATASASPTATPVGVVVEQPAPQKPLPGTASAPPWTGGAGAAALVVLGVAAQLGRRRTRRRNPS
jgi:hypothetical protein